MAQAKTATPRYIIRNSIFLNHRYIMASDSSPVVIETVVRPNPDWEPVNSAARDQLEAHIPRAQKVIKDTDVGTAAHEAIRKMKRAIAKFDKVPFDEGMDEDVEPQDAAYAGVVVSQPRDRVAALRASAAPVKMDRGAQAEAPLGGEPPEEETPAGGEESAPEGEEAATAEQQEEEERIAAQESGELAEAPETASIPVQTAK